MNSVPIITMDIDTTVPKNVTTPVTLNSETGEVIVKKASGKIKIRTGQTLEDYLDQRDQFWYTDSKECTGLNLGWMSSNLDIDKLLSVEILKASKHERQRIIDYLVWLYYHSNTGSNNKENENTKEYSQLIENKIIPVFNEVNIELNGKINKEVALLERLASQLTR